MTPESPSAFPLPGLEGYAFLALQLDQRDGPYYDDGSYHQWGSFHLDVKRDSAKLLLVFDSLTGPLRLSLPGVETNAFQLGELGARVIWVSVSGPISGKVSFAFKSAMPAKLAQVLLLEDESAALPWPPPKPGAQTWRTEKAKFSTMGPSLDQGLWRVKLTIGFNARELPAEFLVTCDCPREELEVSESSDSPRGAGCLIQPGHQPTSFIVTVCPSSLCNYELIALRVKGSKIFRIQSVERVFRP